MLCPRVPTWAGGGGRGGSGADVRLHRTAMVFVNFYLYFIIKQTNKRTQRAMRKKQKAKSKKQSTTRNAERKTHSTNETENKTAATRDANQPQSRVNVIAAAQAASILKRVPPSIRLPRHSQLDLQPCQVNPTLEAPARRGNGGGEGVMKQTNK
jgi:hypothetical protein